MKLVKQQLEYLRKRQNYARVTNEIRILLRMIQRKFISNLQHVRTFFSLKSAESSYSAC